MRDGERFMDSATELARAISQREIKAVDALQACLQRLDERDEELNCFREVNREEAMQAAEAIDRTIARGEPVGPLAGVPIAVKDNMATSFGTTACGSRMLEHYRSPFTATAVQRLINAGAVVVGKTNCDEFAMGSSTEHCAFGAVKNPWDPSRVPGGSSGGSAAAVAARLCPAALGSDTGGSIRQPASFCGVVGFKPSYGRVSRYGLVAYGSSLDQIGPFTADVRDAALLLQVMAGVDPHDSTSSAAPVPDYLSTIDDVINGLKIGVPRQYLSNDNDPAVNATIRNAIDVYKSLGATIVDIDLPMTDYGIATYYVIATAEASSNLARFDGIRYGRRAEIEPGEDLFDLYARSRAEGLGPEVQRRIMLGTYVLSAGYYDAYYKRALQVRRLIKQDFDRAFSQCHALIGPAAPTPAYPLGSKADPISMYLGDVYTVPANIAGICGICVPAGHASVNGAQLPIGLQILGQAFHEDTLFRAARMFERAVNGDARSPLEPASVKRR